MDPELTEYVFKHLAEIYCGENIPDKVVRGMVYLEKHIRNTVGMQHSIGRSHNLESLVKLGPVGIEAAIDRARGYFGKGGEKVYASGLADALNKHRSTRRIPQVSLGKSAD